MEKNREININSELPSHILHHILSKLPFYNLPTCRIVCKAWNDLILTCKFDNYSNLFIAQISPYNNHCHICVDFDAKYLKEMNIVGSFNFHPKWSKIGIANSCNGLLCIFNKGVNPTHFAAILNPVTNEYIELPEGDSDRDYYYGLGFSPETKQYKVARHSIPMRDRLYGNICVEISAFGGTSGCSEWTRIASPEDFVMENHGVYFNGAIYWCGYRDNFHKKICRLDVEDEKFEEICYPHIEFREMGDNSGCGSCVVVNRSLYLTIFDVKNFEYNVWKMVDGTLWIKAFVVGIPNMFWPPSDIQFFKFCKDGKILYLVDSELILYDPKTRRSETLNPGAKKRLSFFQIDSLNFHSLRNILAGDEA